MARGNDTPEGAPERSTFGARLLRVGGAITAVVLLCAVFPNAAFADSPTPDITAAVRAQVCPSTFNAAAADAVLDGHLHDAIFGDVDVGTDIDWSSNPFNHPSWPPQLNNLQWLGSSIARGSPADVDRVRDILQDWVADNPPGGPTAAVAWSARTTGLRATVFECAAPLFSGEAWWQAAIEEHGDALADPAQYAGAWNHGFVQNRSLLTLGCLNGRTDWTNVAEVRATEGIDTAIDAQGADDEQSTAYADYVRQLFEQFARISIACEEPIAPWAPRLGALEDFLAQATRPDGTYEQIGDTYLTRHAPGATPADRYAVYSSGYVFGRTAWAPTAGYFSLRFGPRTQLHGHADHTALTYMAHGDEWLIDAGTPGYETTQYRSWVRSALAHNELVVDHAGKPTNPTTALTIGHSDDSWQLYSLTDRPYAQVKRRRDVLHIAGPQEMFVVRDTGTDTASQRVTFKQLWHLSDSVHVTHPTRQTVEATSADGRRILHIIEVGSPDSLEVLRGSHEPLQGWRSRRFEEHAPAPTVLATTRGQSAKFVTVVVDASSRSAVSARWVSVRGSLVLRVRVGRTTTRDIGIGPSGPRPVSP